MKDQTKKILERGRAGAGDSPEAREMMALFHQPDLEFEVKDALLNALEELEFREDISGDYPGMFNRIWKRIEAGQEKPGRKKLIRLVPLLRIASVLLIGFLTGLAVNHFTGKPEPVYHRAHSPGGSVADLTMPDGSVIYLNAETDIRYSMNGGKNSREVFLNGEAWFDVKSDRQHPFVVHTDWYDVIVTGTKFNVKAYENEDEVATTLEEGELRIRPAINERAANGISLEPGQQLILDKASNRMKIRKVNPRIFTSWKNNQLIFVNHPLEDLVLILERRYGVDIEVKNEELLDLHFDGTFEDRSLIEVLEVLKKTMVVDYRIDGEKIEIISETK